MNRNSVNRQVLLTVIYSLLVVLCSLFTAFAQKQGQAKIDSLLAVLKTAKEDTNKVNTLIAVCQEKSNLGRYDEAMKYADEALALSEKISYKNGIAVFYKLIGTTYFRLSDYPKALEYWQKSLIIYEQLGNKVGISNNLNNIGSVYAVLSDYPKSLEYQQKALTIFEQLGIKGGIASALGNIGNIYLSLSDCPKALQYYQKSLTMMEQLGNKATIAEGLNDIGDVYFKLSDYPKALEYDQKALKIVEEIGDKNIIANVYNDIGNIYQKQNKLSDALKYETKGLSLAMEIRANDKIKVAYGELAVIDSAMSNFRGAYENHKLYMQVNDSMFNIEKDKKITTLAMNYEFAKVQDSTKAEQTKKDAIAVKEMQKQKLVRNGFVGGFAVMLLFAGIFFTQRNKIKNGKKLSDELLLNILPSEVAEELKAKGSAEAKMFDDVTVMFTDFKGFTKISEKLSAKELVSEINYCFSAFDNIIHKYGIEKIKTIGDSYMAAGGLPVANKTHAKDVVNAAIEINKFMEEHKQQRIAEGKEVFEIRIGIHTGPVVAGIVGVKKFAYDIWGDTVNLAARMESSGEAGKINISGNTYQLVKDKFNCVHRGKIQAKNKGEVDMYFVET